jgi:transposase-like protein
MDKEQRREYEQRKRHEKTRAEKDSTLNLAALPAACMDELKAVEFIERQRWGDTPACPRCGVLDVYQMLSRSGERGRRYLWRCRGCGQQFTVRIGTVFEDSRIPLKHWCFAFWRACSGKKGVSALEIRRVTQVSYKSALFMMHRIRYAMTPDATTPPKLTGTVEADETYIGGKTRPLSQEAWKKARERAKAAGHKTIRKGLHSDKVPVMAMIERGGNVRALVLPNVTAKNVKAALLANVSPDAHLRTDEGTQYTPVGRRFASHEAVKHSLHQYVKGDASTNAAESFFSRLKRTLYGTHHAVSKQHLHRYVSEVAFKHNTRKLDDGERVALAIKGADGKRLQYRTPRS